jgi:hypothetical protein
LKPTRQCQLLDLLWMEDPAFREFITSNGGIGWARNAATEVHHIFGGTQRIDRAANLIRLSNPVHLWIHHRPIEGRVSCLYRQKQLGKLDWSVLDFCAGRDVRGLVSSKVLTGVFERWRQELLA